MRTSPRRSAAIPICWCIARSKRRWLPQFLLRSSLHDGRIADPRRREFAARAARRRCIARCDGLPEVPVPAAAGRRDLRCDDHQRARIRPVRAAEGNAHRRVGAYFGNSRETIGNSSTAAWAWSGQRTGRRWQLGDTVRVRLSRVDLTQRQIDFELLDADGAASHGTVRAPRPRRKGPRQRGAVADNAGGGGPKRGRGGRG